MNALHKIAADVAGIIRVCGARVAAKWLFLVIVNLSAVLKSRNLQVADRAMGDGPFEVSRAQSRALLTGTQAFSGLREIWVRDVYLKNDFLSVPRNAVVLDLGANLGVFSALALAQHESVRVIAVEPNRALSASLERSIRANGWSNRLTLVRAFIGNFTKGQEQALTESDNYDDAPTITEAELIARSGLSKIDFLKCDIEGSEFFLLDPESRLLEMTDQLAIEVHKWGGDVEAFLSHLTEVGFEIAPVEWAHGSCIALCRRNVAAASVAQAASARA